MHTAELISQMPTLKLVPEMVPTPQQNFVQRLWHTVSTEWHLMLTPATTTDRAAYAHSTTDDVEQEIAFNIAVTPLLYWDSSHPTLP